MKRKVMPNGEGMAASILHYPVRGSESPEISTWIERWPWIQRRLQELGVRTMATSTSPPSWNWSIIGGISSLLGVVVLLFGLACGASWYLGYQARQIEELNQKTAEATKKAEAADTKATYAVAGTDEDNGHKPAGKKPPKEGK